MTMFRWALGMVLVAGVGCGDAVSSSVVDSGVVDSGVVDSGVVDSGADSGTDSGTDSGVVDSGADSGTDSGGGTNVCDDVCAAQARANCSAFQMVTCVSTCQAQLSGFPQCSAQIEAAARCAAGATFTCNSSNRPTTMSCLSEGIMALQCTQGDAGT